MRVCLVSTYPPKRCGIATYSAALAREFAADGGGAPRVISEIGSLDGSDGEVTSIPTFRRTDDYATAIAEAARRAGADLVHVQHSSDILGMDARLPRLLALLRNARIRSVVTLHSVHSRTSGAIERKLGVVRFHRLLGEHADAIVVHGARAMADELVDQGVPLRKISIIAHGTGSIADIGQSEARRRLGLPVTGPLLLYFGFIHPQKNVHTILLALALLRRKNPDVHLCIAGSVQNPSATNRAYLALLRRLPGALGLPEKVSFHIGFASPEEERLLYRACDLVLLPYAQGYGSASGVAHQAMGAGRLPLCSRSPKFDEVAEFIDPGLLVSTYSPFSWARAVARLLGDERRRSELVLRARGFAAETSWSRTAERHRALYRSLA